MARRDECLGPITDFQNVLVQNGPTIQNGPNTQNDSKPTQKWTSYPQLDQYGPNSETRPQMNRNRPKLTKYQRLTQNRPKSWLDRHFENPFL